MSAHSAHSPASPWFGRSDFYEERVAFRPRESAKFYQHLLRDHYRFLVPPGAVTLEVGCGLGDLLAAVQPSRGIGIDFSPKTVALARQRHPDLEFHIGDAVDWFPRESSHAALPIASFSAARSSPARSGTRVVQRSGVIAESASARKMCPIATELFPLSSRRTSAGNLGDFPSETFDYILLSDLINDLADVQAVFEHLRTLAHPRTRLVLNFLNTLWRPALALAEKVGAKAPCLLQNWLSTSDVTNLLHLADWETVKIEHKVLWPIRTPLLEPLLNRYLAPLLPDFCLTIFIVARPKPQQTVPRHHRCSIVIPARNEAGNIEAAVQRTPELGRGTEIIFVEGHSKDSTWDEIQRVAQAYPQRCIKCLKQKGKGKGDAVREGFAAATGDLLFILDADLTVAPEDLPKFYEIVRTGTADLINGVRLVYPMEHEAMRFLNLIANKLFGLAFSWLLGQRIKDTLCGTKVLFRSDYDMIARNRSYFGDFDPFGDFDLLFGAAKLNLRLIDLPIRYHARTYGETNIQRWRHGWLLMRMVLFAARWLKFLR